MKYRIICLENAPLSSWDEPHTKQELIDKFYSYAEMEWEEEPDKDIFTLDFIQELWNVRFEEITEEEE